MVAVVVTRNSAGDLPRCLAALKAGGIAETVVVDNASTDGGAALARSLGARVMENRENRGYGAGLNQGIAATTAGGVLCLNADVEVARESASRLARVLEAHDRCGVVGPRLRHPDGTLQPSVNMSFPGCGSFLADVSGLAGLKMRLYNTGIVRRAIGPLWYGPLHQGTFRVAWVGGACLLVRRAAWEAVGGFDERFFLYYEEVDLCRRLSGSGWEAWFCGEAEAVHGWGTSTVAEPALAAASARRSRALYFSTHGGALLRKFTQ